jgi:hypothetical protein
MTTMIPMQTDDEMRAAQQKKAQEDEAYAELERKEAEAMKASESAKKADAAKPAGAEDPAAARPGHVAEAPKKAPEAGSGGTPLDASVRDNPMPQTAEDGQERARKAAIAAGVDPIVANSATVPGSNL